MKAATPFYFANCATGIGCESDTYCQSGARPLGLSRPSGCYRSNPAYLLDSNQDPRRLRAGYFRSSLHTLACNLHHSLCIPGENP